MPTKLITALLAFAFCSTAAHAESPGNLLRNGDFQDDWITNLPDNKTMHWTYIQDIYNRRDFNPDGWTCSGSWRWENADAPRGERKLVITGPNAQLLQRVNWCVVHDQEKRTGFPDAGGYPIALPLRSKKPERLLRDLTLTLRLNGKNIPENAGEIQIAWSEHEPVMGQVEMPQPATAPLPAGTYQAREITVKLPAAAWVQARAAAVAKTPAEATEVAKSGSLLPASVNVAIKYSGKTGEAELVNAELTATEPASPNILPHGGFESSPTGENYPTGWDRPEKYTYFPPGYYYMFTTWHNRNSPNRGPVELEPLVTHSGRQSLRMSVPSGDEKSVASAPIKLKQTEPRLIEVSAWVKTNHLAFLQIDAVDEQGQRIDCFNFLHKMPVSIGTNEWRQIRQVFRPKKPLDSIRLKLCARGVNGYTLDDTDSQPQNNTCGTIWWDDVRLTEPESTATELATRGLKAIVEPSATPDVRITNLDLGEQLIGSNTIRGTFVNNGPAGSFELSWKNRDSGWAFIRIIKAAQGESVPFIAPYNVYYQFYNPPRLMTKSYFEFPYELSVSRYDDRKREPIKPAIGTSEIRTVAWSVPIHLQLGALYLQPNQKQFVRLNFGVTHNKLADLGAVKLEIVRLGTGQIVHSVTHPCSLATFAEQRKKIPVELRDDFANLFIADLDVSMLPVQPFADPQRNWFVRATALDKSGKPFILSRLVALKAGAKTELELDPANSAPFCRLAHDPPQPAVGSVRVDKHHLLTIDNKPWMPWGVVYGNCDTYEGPADPGPGKYRDMQNVPSWGLYDRFANKAANRHHFDMNTLRYVAASISNQEQVEKLWKTDNLYCSSAYVVPDVVYSIEELTKNAGGASKLAAHLQFCKTGPVVSTAPGIEEAFALFTTLSPEKLAGLQKVTEYLRQQTGKPVMVGHGGTWNRFEFEKVPFFDIYDPETEPFFPANIHTDLAPLIEGKAQTIWLRPQMYESIPYERWRFHTYVELMRGVRGWQMAHGTGDQSLFRGLHGEMEFIKPIAYSTDPGAAVRIEPWIEHFSRKHNGKQYVIAATTRGLAFGHWSNSDIKSPVGQTRSTDADDPLNQIGTAHRGNDQLGRKISAHGVQHLPSARKFAPGSKLVQWVQLDSKRPAKNIVLIVKGDGRWTHAALWSATKPSGKITADDLFAKTPRLTDDMLHKFYRHAPGFLGWGFDAKLVSAARQYLPSQLVEMGSLPRPNDWFELEVPLEKIGAGGQLIDGVACLHEEGIVQWGHTLIVEPDGTKFTVWGDSLVLPSEQLEKTKIHVAGLKPGTKVRVLFEDRELTAADGHFIDDFRGEDVYQRFGGDFGAGYGSAPTALHLYETPLP